MLPLLVCLIIFIACHSLNSKKHGYNLNTRRISFSERIYVCFCQAPGGANNTRYLYCVFYAWEAGLKCTCGLVLLQFALSPRTQSNPKHKEFANTCLHTHILCWALDLTFSCPSFLRLLKALLSLSLASSVVSKLHPTHIPLAYRGKVG